MKFRQGFSGALLQQLGVGTNYRSPRLLAPQGGSMLVPHVDEGGGVSRGWPEGDLDGLPTPLVVLCAGAVGQLIPSAIQFSGHLPQSEPPAGPQPCYSLCNA